MCTGAEALIAAGLAGSAAGTGLSIAQAQANRDSMNKVIEDQMRVQQGYQKEQSDAFNKSLQESGVKQSQGDINQGTQDAGQLYRQLQSQAPSVASSPINVNPIMAGSNATVIGQNNAAQAGLQGVQSFNLQQWLRNMTAQSKLGVTNNLSQSSAALTPTLTQLAGSDNTLAGIGSILGTVGNLASVYGALQPSTFAGKIGAMGPVKGTQLPSKYPTGL